MRAFTDDGTMVLRGTVEGLVAVDDVGPVDAEVRCGAEQLLGVLSGAATVAQLVADGEVEVTGDVDAVDELLRPRRPSHA